MLQTRFLIGWGISCGSFQSEALSSNGCLNWYRDSNLYVIPLNVWNYNDWHWCWKILYLVHSGHNSNRKFLYYRTGESCCSTNRSQGMKIPSNQWENSYLRFGLRSQYNQSLSLSLVTSDRIDIEMKTSCDCFNPMVKPILSRRTDGYHRKSSLNRAINK